MLTITLIICTRLVYQKSWAWAPSIQDGVGSVVAVILQLSQEIDDGHVASAGFGSTQMVCRRCTTRGKENCVVALFYDVCHPTGNDEADDSYLHGIHKALVKVLDAMVEDNFVMALPQATVSADHSSNNPGLSEDLGGDACASPEVLTLDAAVESTIGATPWPVIPPNT